MQSSGFEAEISVLSPTISTSSETPDFIWIERWPDLPTFGKTAGLFFDPGGEHTNVPEEAFKLWDCVNSLWAGEVYFQGAQ